ncbi:unnamed protein product [Trichobilharzia regenti]|nr:unnamed protein product [Trichobilharzia regenti]
MNSENSSRFCDSPSELIVRSHETESLEMPAEVVMDTGVVEISQVEHKHSSSNLSCSVQLENLSSASLVKMSQKLVQINDDAQLEIASPRLINESKHASPPTNFSTDTDSESLQLNAKVNDTIQSFKVSHENHPESSSNYETKNSENSEVHQSDNLLLHKQIETLTCKLLATQEQVDRLLEEKRLWVGNMPNANTAKEPNHQVTSGELRGRWMQAKNLAETYKREKEAMVIKYAQVSVFS